MEAGDKGLSLLGFGIDAAFEKGAVVVCSGAGVVAKSLAEATVVCISDALFVTAGDAVDAVDATALLVALATTFAGAFTVGAFVIGLLATFKATCASTGG